MITNQITHKPIITSPIKKRATTANPQPFRIPPVDFKPSLKFFFRIHSTTKIPTAAKSSPPNGGSTNVPTTAQNQCNRDAHPACTGFARLVAHEIVIHQVSADHQQCDHTKEDPRPDRESIHDPVSKDCQPDDGEPGDDIK